MTPFHNRLTPLTRRMAEDMQVRNLSPRTIDSYTYHVDKFTQHFHQAAEELGPEQIREYQLYLVNDRKVGWSSFNQAVCALRFLYRFTLPRDWHIQMIPFGKPYGDSEWISRTAEELGLESTLRAPQRPKKEQSGS